MKKALLALKKPKVFIPLVLGVALIVALISFSDIHKVLRLLSGFQRLYLLYYLLLMIAYEVVRGIQWHYSLTRLKVRAPLSAQILAFALSEVTKVLPIGNYFQNYVLQQAEGTDIGLTSAATTLFILEEVIVSLVGVVILGLGGWTVWLRPLIIVGVAIAVVVIWLLARFHHGGGRPEWVARHKALRKIADEFGHFREGAVDLMRPRPLAVTFACSATYLVIGGAALYVVLEGLGIPNASFTEALAVYFFSLAVALMLPIPVDFGVIEISGVGAFVAVGVTRDAAIGAVLANRILSILASIAIAAVVVLILHKEVAVLFTYMFKDRNGGAGKTPNGGDGHGRIHADSDAPSQPASRDADTQSPQDIQPNSALRQASEAPRKNEVMRRWNPRAQPRLRRRQRTHSARWLAWRGWRGWRGWLRSAYARARSA